jgi:phosphosulfolactate synthase (CoM biosynthesis protein A)
MTKYLWDELYPDPTRSKPRTIGQTWLKDPGLADSEWGSRIGLTELADFLDAMASRIDYVKFMPEQVIICPHGWLARKVETYARYGVPAYFDHGYFNLAQRTGVRLEDAILASRELGISTMEFWNAGKPVSPARWGELTRFAASNELKIIFEYHPAHLFDTTTGLRLRTPSVPERPIDVDEIVRTAMPCLEAGAMAVMVDHKTFDDLGDRAEEVLVALVNRLGIARVIFEVDSEKHKEHLAGYLKIIGPEANLANLLPGQLTSVDIMRWKLF